MEKEQIEKNNVLPPIHEGKDVKDGEPKITCGGKVAAWPQPNKQMEA